ncbi:uncharacterized protein LOC141841847 isoform X1 [Curcuma longa]|uniref:uncharacterized protein LOC141841847 isoform X1 n=1 Tax=Curcuma longa TaxID=136217 RepID=UPI003D9EDADA
MAGKEPKIATVIIKVDLECCCCSKKIKRTLCKLQKRFKINSIVYDEKKNTVTVSGAFNPDCFIKKLCCMAYKVIKDVEIKKPDPPPPPPPQVPKPADPKPASKPPAPPPQVPKPDPKPDPKPPPPPPPPQVPPEVIVKFPMWAFPAPMWPCCCQPCPCYEPHQGCCRCCSCGHVSSAPQPPKPVVDPPPSQPAYYGGYPCYKIVCEDEPSYGCSIM